MISTRRETVFWWDSQSPRETFLDAAAMTSWQGLMRPMPARRTLGARRAETRSLVDAWRNRCDDPQVATRRASRERGP